MLLKREICPHLEAALDAVLEGLGKRARLVLKLHLVSGLTLAAIGETFGVAQSTVSRWLADTRASIVAAVHHCLEHRLQLARDEVPSIARQFATDLDIDISPLLDA